MDKETMSSYGMILISVLLMALLITLATPIGNRILDDVQIKMTKFVDNSGVMDSETDYSKYGTIVVHYRYENTTEDLQTYETTVRLGEYCLIEYPDIIGYKPANEDGSYAPAKVQATENLKHIYIYYVPRTYKIDYVWNGGKINDGVSYVVEYQYGSTVILPTDDAITKDGYQFTGWYTDSGLGGKRVYSIGSKDYGDKIFFAKYTMN